MHKKYLISVVFFILIAGSIVLLASNASFSFNAHEEPNSNNVRILNSKLVDDQLSAPEDQLPVWAYAFDTPPKPGDTYKPQKGTSKGGLRPGENPDELHKPLRAESSEEQFSRVQIRDFHNVIDWFPQDHPPMPDIIRHGPEKLRDIRPWSCGSCHLPNGAGRPENAPVAGLPFEYIMQQLRDFRTGKRRSADPRKKNTPTMIRFAKAMTEQEMLEAAEYFAAIPQKYSIEVIEATEIPEVKLKLGGMYLLTNSGEKQLLGNKIVETPKDAHQSNSLRNPRSGWLAYVPVGSIAQGESLVKTGDDKTLPCTSCHGTDLTGIGSVPGIAGRSPSYMMRQLYDFKVGARVGAMAATMKPVVANLDTQDMQAIVAYLASLRPQN